MRETCLIISGIDPIMGPHTRLLDLSEKTLDNSLKNRYTCVKFKEDSSPVSARKPCLRQPRQRRHAEPACKGGSCLRCKGWILNSYSDLMQEEEAMKSLWSPWRMKYILERKPKGCIFCAKLIEKKDEENLILYRGKRAIVLMNKFPYNNGHLMVIPRRHCIDMEELDDNELYELTHLLKASIQVLKASIGPHGFNIGLNLGKAGGAGEEHLHFHIVPRWTGDTNFMPVLGETKIIPEYLARTYQKLRSAFKDLLGEKRRKGGRKE